MRILYHSKDLRYKKPFGALKERETCEITIKIPQSCETFRVELRLQRENGEPFASYYMKKAGEEGAYDIFSCSFSLSVADLYFYCFWIQTAHEEFLLYRQGYEDTNMCQGDLWQLTVYPEDFHTPDLAGSVMYQIFPDRFFSAGSVSLKNKIQPYWVHQDKREIPSYQPNDKGEVTNNDFYGGNLLGIEKKLPYLQSLGVNVIYCNPVFKAFSNHRYDTADYEAIDEMLGTKKDFSRLCQKAHRRGMKVILDGVFSHTGSDSRYFDGRGTFGGGAVSDPNSPYRQWFDFQEYPEKYTSWWGIRTLPCVKEETPSYLDYIIENENSVCARWLCAGADGWRLDVADELPDEFLCRFRRKMKEINPDSFLLGEVWEDASNKISYGVRRRYFSGGELDSVMNYPFREAILNFVTGKDEGYGFRKIVMEIAENYPPCVLPLLMNFLSTHDTPRVLSVLGAEPPETKEERAVFSLTEQQRRSAEEKLRVAVFLQYILPGIPSVYYGDEIGMEGWEDPFCRGYFQWEKKSDLPKFYKALAELRREKDLQSPGIQVEILSPGVLRIARGEKLFSLINVSEKAVEFSKKEVLFSEKAEIGEENVRILPFGVVLMQG